MFLYILSVLYDGVAVHRLDHMQIICTMVQTDKHASTSPLSFYRPDALVADQPTVSKHWRHLPVKHMLKILISSCNTILRGETLHTNVDNSLK